MDFTENQMYEAIHRLCHFIPFDSSENFSRSVHEFLVQHAMAACDMIPLQPSDVCKSLENLFGLGIELDEVEDTLKRLYKTKKVDYIKGKYRFKRIKYNEFRQTVKECADHEKKIIDDWLKLVETKHPEVSNDDLQMLAKDLKIYSAKIFIQHGAKCASLIDAEQEKITEIIGSPEEFLSEILPKYPALDNIRSTELPAFFRDAKGERRTYIAELLDSSFMLHVIQIDDTCSNLLQTILKGRLLYLDTNVLYALLGLHTPRDAKAIRRLIEISKEMGYVVVISTKTAEEFKVSLNYAANSLKNKRFSKIPKNVAKVAAIYSAGGFIPAYWRKCAETGISRRDFISTYLNFESLLAEYPVDIRDELCAEVQEDPELKNQIELLYASANPTIIPANLAEHDAFHRLLIKKLRGDKANKFSAASAWFLTFDKKLNRYDTLARSEEVDGLSEVPFCISCGDWLQFIRPLLPRTDDFNKTFTNLLSSPYFRSYGEVPTQLAEKIIARLTHFEAYSPEVAAKMLTDSLFLQQLERIEDEIEQKELIDGEIAASTNEIREENEQYKKLLEKEKKISKIIQDEKARIEEQKGEQQRKYEDDIEKLNKKFEGLIKYINWCATILIWVLVSLLLILISWKNLGFQIKFLIVCTASFISLMVLAIPIGWSRTFRVIAIIGAVAHIILLIKLVMEYLE